MFKFGDFSFIFDMDYHKLNRLNRKQGTGHKDAARDHNRLRPLLLVWRCAPGPRVSSGHAMRVSGLHRVTGGLKHPEEPRVVGRLVARP